MLKIFIAALIAYLIGSVSTSIIVSKIILGDDIRNHGSGNAGATNALRTMGKKGGALVVLGDALKAVIAILIAKLIVGTDVAVYAAGIGVVLGHNFPIYFGFKGGKGILVSLVSILFADWRIGVLTAVISILIMVISNYVSLGSICGAVLLVIFGAVFRAADVYFMTFAIVLAVLAIFMHRSNIKRLINKSENKTYFGKKREEK